MPALDCFVHTTKVIDGDALYCANNDITCGQHAREQGCRKHEGKDYEPHLCAATRNVAHTNLKKDQVAESQQCYQANNGQRDYCENCHECIEWNTKKSSHVLCYLAVARAAATLCTRRATLQCLIKQL